jgi:hypothetical protein
VPENTIEFVVKLKGGEQSAAEIRKVESAVSGVGGKMRAVGAESERQGKRVGAFGGGLKKLALGLGALGAGYAAYAGAKNAISYTTTLAKATNVLSKNTSLSAGEASRLAGVTEVMGISAGKLGMLIRNLSQQQVKQAGNTNHSATAFEKLGISQQFAKRHLGDFQGTLSMVLDKLKEHGKTADLVTTKAELFGRGWKEVDGILREGSKGFNKWMETAKKFGVELQSTADITKLIHAQKEYELALDGLKIKFTQIAAGPLTSLLGGFSNLIKLGKEAKWGSFNREIDKIGGTMSHLAEKVMPRIAESFARIAPAVFKAFVRGFLNANPGAQGLLALVLLSKLGFTSAVFSGAGKKLGGKLVGGMAAESGAFAAAGATLGAAFEVAFLAAAVVGVAILAYKIGKLLSPAEKEYVDPTGKPLSPDQVKTQGKAEAKHEHALRERSRKEDPGLAHREAAYERKRKAAGIPKAAMGGRTVTSGLVEVGERGREVVHLPQGAVVDPLRPGSLADNRPIILKVDGRVLARVNRRETLQSQAAGA